MERSALQGLAAFRWGAWLWMATVLLVSRDQLERPWLAMGLVGMALAVTATDTVLLRARPEALCRPGPVVAELAVGAMLVLCDGVAYGSGHAFSTSQSLGSVWPLTGILGVGVAFGPMAAAGSGVLIGLARVGAVLTNGASIDTGGRVLSVTNTMVFYALGGAAAGYLARLLRRAEAEISAARAREEVARTLHDGVLQTLAVVERRATDPALARLAREQERELRDWLFRSAAPAGVVADVGTALRAAAARFEDAFGGRAQVLVADDLPPLDPAAVAALTGAAAVPACWLLAFQLERGGRRLGDVARLALLVPVLGALYLSPAQGVPVLLAAAVLYAADAVRLGRPEVGIGAALAVQGLVAQVALGAGITGPAVGLALCVAAVVWAGLAVVVDEEWRVPFLAAAGSGLVFGLSIASTDPVILANALLIAGGLAIGAGVSGRRSEVAHAGGVLCTAAIAIHLATAGVAASEPYVAPVAAQLLVAGWMSRRPNRPSAPGPPTCLLWPCWEERHCWSGWTAGPVGTGWSPVLSGPRRSQ